MKVTIEGRINVDGAWWDIAIDHAMPNSWPAEQKIERIERVIRGLVKTGSVISRVDNSVPVKAAPTPEAQGSNGPASQAPLFTWPYPHCKGHGEAMVPSKTQKSEGYTMFYCPKRAGEGYCTHRAKVHMDTGLPSFWEVK